MKIIVVFLAKPLYNYTIHTEKEEQKMINDIMSRQTKGQPTPEVGMGATWFSGSDRYAATIVEVIEKNGTFIIAIQDDNAQVTNIGSGGTGGEEYEYSKNEKGCIRHFRFKKDGVKWENVVKNEETGRWNLGYGNCAIGYRQAYRNPSF